MSSGSVLLARFHLKGVADCCLSTFLKGVLFPILRDFVDRRQVIIMWAELNACVQLLLL